MTAAAPLVEHFQPALFASVGPQPGEAGVRCPKAETAPSLSGMRDKRRFDRLGKLAARIAQANDAVDQARAAAQLRDLADVLLGELVREANQAGRTWREIGAALGVPFQTLYGRYGAAGAVEANLQPTS